MTKQCLNIRFRIKIMLFGLLSAPVMVHAETCPGKDMPETVKALYIKYKITDEKFINLNRKWGAPSTVVGDELEELIVWKNHRWQRLFGKYWNTDEETEAAYQAQTDARLDYILEQQMAGNEYSEEKINKLSAEYMNHKPKQKIHEYDRISVDAPYYSLYYNRSNSTGYGFRTINNSGAQRKRMDKTGRDQLDTWLSNNFKDTNKIFGFKKITSKKSKILGHDVKCETVTTSFKDALRDYGQIEMCKAKIAGIEVNLYEKMGNAGQQYIKQAVEIKIAYPARKDIFCAPDYVKMSAP